MAAVSVDPPRVLEAFKAGLGARFTFLSDEDRALTNALGISESTDRKHGPLPVPFTFVGRPTPEELRIAARELTDLAVSDLDSRDD